MLFHKNVMKFKRFSSSAIILYALFNTSLNTSFSIENKKSKHQFFQKDIITLEKKDSSKLITEMNKNKRKLISTKNIEKIISLNSHELKMMRYKIQEAKYLLKSEIASWYPTLNLSSSGFPQYIKGDTYNKLSNDTSNDQAKASLSATIKWDLINPARIPQINIARDNLRNAEIAYDMKLRDLSLEAYAEYFNFQKSFQEIRIANQAIKSAQISLKEAENKFEAGLGTKFELLEAQTQLSKEEQFLNNKLGEKNMKEKKLLELLNLEDNKTIEINNKPSIFGIWNSSLNESIEHAYKYRKELEEVLLKIKINNNQGKVSLAGKKPKVSIYNTIDNSFAQGEVGVVSPRSNNNINTFNNTIGIQFEWPIFDGGYSQAKYLSNEAKVNEMSSKLELVKNQIKYEIAEIYIKMETAKNNIKHSYQAILSSKESLRLSLLRLKAGIATQREVVNNQRDLTQAEANHIGFITEYNTNLLKLSKKTGLKKIVSCTSKEPINKNSDTQDSITKDSSNSFSLLTTTCMELL